MPDLSPDEWAALAREAEPLYRGAFALCELVVKRGLPMEHPAYHFSGAALAALIDLRNAAERAQRGEGVARCKPVSMSNWVKPWAGGGVVPGRGRAE